jgi:hypothetical protein
MQISNMSYMPYANNMQNTANASVNMMANEGGDVSDIAGPSGGGSAAAMQTEASARVLDMAMDTMGQQGADLIQMMNASFTGFGQNFDRSV